MIHNVELSPLAHGGKQPKFFLVSCHDGNEATVHAYRQCLASGFTHKVVRYYDENGQEKTKIVALSPSDFWVSTSLRLQPLAR